MKSFRRTVITIISVVSNLLYISFYRKQIAANTRRLVMSKHAQKVEESPLIKTKLTPVRVDGVSVDEQRLKGT